MSSGMTCQDLVELITDYLEGSLPADERARFDAHLGMCEGCRAYLDQMRRTIALMGRLTEESIPPAERQQLLEIFRTWKQAG